LSLGRPFRSKLRNHLRGCFNGVWLLDEIQRYTLLHSILAGTKGSGCVTDRIYATRSFPAGGSNIERDL
jgi:hypothetical protein